MACVRGPVVTGLALAIVGALGEVTPPAPGGVTFAAGPVFDSMTSGSASVTFNDTLIAGNALIVAMNDRSGISQTTHAITDANGKTYTKLGFLDHNLGNGSERQAVSIWGRTVDASGETDTTPTITGSDGTGNTKGFSVRQITPSSPVTFDWANAIVAINASGAADWNGLSSGAVAGAGRYFEFAMATCRNSGSGTFPTVASLAPQTNAAAQSFSGANQLSHLFGLNTNEVTGGSGSTTVTSDGSGNEGIAATIRVPIS